MANTTTPAPTQEQQRSTAVAERTTADMAAKFTDKVIAEFSTNAGPVELTDYQRQLVHGYFISIDRALKTAEEERIRRNANNKDHEKYDNPLPFTWQNVNLTDLALDVVHYARMGLDMMEPNHLFPIPYKNNKNNNYDMTLMPGYAGIQYAALKYAYDDLENVTVELVYDTDTFRPIKKGIGNKVESYEFSINSPFDRGKVVGGFGYIEYEDPTKNKLVIMSLHDIEKRKPRYASANFWGGKVKEWQNGKQVETEVEGWYEEMCEKTVKREVYSPKNIPRDPKKIDDAYQYMKMREAQIANIEAQAEIDANANTITIDTAPPAELPEPAVFTEPIQEPLTPAEAAKAATPAPTGGPTF